MPAVVTSPVRTVTLEDQMEFPEAIAAVINNQRVTRVLWNSDECIFLADGFLMLRKADGTMHRLLVSDGDMQATDWIVVREQ